MEALSAYNVQLKAKLNLSKISFCLDTFKLLNKNLNFVPTPKKCNKKQLNTDAEIFELTSRISTQSQT